MSATKSKKNIKAKKGKKSINHSNIKQRIWADSSDDEIEDIFYVYQFKITLEGTKPAVWRRIQVCHYNFFFKDLFWCIQECMGWRETYAHYFIVSNPRNGNEEKIGCMCGCSSTIMPILNQDEKQLNEYFLRPGDKSTYMFGGWKHKVVFEKLLPGVKGTDYPICIDGKMACPPDECLVAETYEELKKAISDPKHAKYKEKKEWLKKVKHDNFKPEEFDPKKIKFTSIEGECSIQ